MRHIFFWGIFTQVSCGEKEQERKEGEVQGDCLDGEDNDNDGNIDCEDAGCSSKPACEETQEENNDTAEDMWEPSSEPSNEPGIEPSAEPSNEPESGSDVTFLGAYGIVNIDNTEIASSVSLDSTVIENSFFIVMAFEDWGGVGDFNNACVLQFSLNDASIDYSFFSEVSDGWIGWTFSGSSNFQGESSGCYNLSSNFTSMYEDFKTSSFGLGFGTLTSNMQSALQDLVSSSEWEENYAPYYYSQYVKLSSDMFADGSSGWSGTNFSVAYEVNSNGVLTETTNESGETINVLIDITGSTSVPDGLHYGSLGFGWGFN